MGILKAVGTRRAGERLHLPHDRTELWQLESLWGVPNNPRSNMKVLTGQGALSEMLALGGETLSLATLLLPVSFSYSGDAK